jgi:hypothetical protein
MDGGDDVERKPDARNDDRTDTDLSMTACRIGVSSDFALIEFVDVTAVLDRSRCRLSPLWLTGAFYGPQQRSGMGLHGILPDRRFTMLGNRSQPPHHPNR